MQFITLTVLVFVWSRKVQELIFAREVVSYGRSCNTLTGLVLFRFTKIDAPRTLRTFSKCLKKDYGFCVTEAKIEHTEADLKISDFLPKESAGRQKRPIFVAITMLQYSTVSSFVLHVVTNTIKISYFDDWILATSSDEAKYLSLCVTNQHLVNLGKAETRLSCSPISKGLFSSGQFAKSALLGNMQHQLVLDGILGLTGFSTSRQCIVYCTVSISNFWIYSSTESDSSNRTKKTAQSSSSMKIQVTNGKFLTAYVLCFLIPPNKMLPVPLALRSGKLHLRNSTGHFHFL